MLRTIVEICSILTELVAVFLVTTDLYDRIFLQKVASRTASWLDRTKAAFVRLGGAIQRNVVQLVLPGWAQRHPLVYAGASFAFGLMGVLFPFLTSEPSVLGVPSVAIGAVLLVSSFTNLIVGLAQLAKEHGIFLAAGLLLFVIAKLLALGPLIADLVGGYQLGDT